MARGTGRIPAGGRILMNFINGVELSDDRNSVVDMEFEFFDDGDVSSPESYSNFEIDIEEDSDDKDQNEQSDAERKAFWEAQHQLLHANLSRTSSLESRIRQATKLALKESQLAGRTCICQRPVMVTGKGCRICLKRDISDRLREAGFDSAICKSKWRSSPDIPSGEHTCIDVLDGSSSKKGEVRVVIELNFRAEFEMARASEEYNRLIGALPEVFIGKAERLRNVVKIVCSAAKKCMKENKMHMGPWRKHKYMQAKWFGTCERSKSASTQVSSGVCIKLQRPKSSMLTLDLVERLPALHCTAVEV